jgi:hypothetical protein
MSGSFTHLTTLCIGVPGLSWPLLQLLPLILQGDTSSSVTLKTKIKMMDKLLLLLSLPQPPLPPLQPGIADPPWIELNALRWKDFGLFCKTLLTFTPPFLLHGQMFNCSEVIPSSPLLMAEASFSSLHDHL